MDGSFVEPNGPNSLLKQEILDAKDYGKLCHNYYNYYNNQGVPNPR